MAVFLPVFATVSDAVTELRRLFYASSQPNDAGRAAAATLRALMQAAPERPDIMRAILIDGARATTPSMLLLAAASGDLSTFAALRGAGASLQQGEDAYAAIVDAALTAPELTGRDDAWVCAAFEILQGTGVPLPRTPHKSRATAACLKHGWTHSLQIMSAIDPRTNDVSTAPMGLPPPELPPPDAPVDTVSVDTGAEAPPAVVQDAPAEEHDTVGENAAAQLRRAITRAQVSVDGSDLDVHAPARVFARALAHALIREHTLSSALTHTSDDGVSILAAAARTRDIDLVLALARAGAQPREGEDIHDAVISGAAPVINATGAVVDGPRLAGYLRELQEAGVLSVRDMAA